MGFAGLIGASHDFQGNGLVIEPVIAFGLEDIPHPAGANNICDFPDIDNFAKRLCRRFIIKVAN